MTDRGPAIGALKVLVIDDESDLADIAGALLTAYGIANCVAYSAQEGLRALAHDPDINAVFSDIMMPEMTGLHLADAVKARYPDVHVVLTSGFTSLSILAAHHSIYAFIPKPYNIEAVIELLRKPKRVEPESTR
jgi:two-component system OmpR family response regulator